MLVIVKLVGRKFASHFGVVLFKKLGNGSYIPVKASKTFNAMHKSEQKRLLEAFPDEEDIFICVIK